MTLDDVRRIVQEAKESNLKLAYLIHPGDLEALREEIQIDSMTHNRKCFSETTPNIRLFGVPVLVSAFAPRGQLTPVPAEVLEPIRIPPMPVR